MAKKYKPVPKKKSAKGAKSKQTANISSKAENVAPPKVVSTASAKKPARTRASRIKKQEEEEVLPFGRMNYILLIVGIVIIGLGFFLLSLDDFVDATEFSISLYIAPVVIVGGFIEIIYAIMYKDKSQPVPSTAGA